MTETSKTATHINLLDSAISNLRAQEMKGARFATDLNEGDFQTLVKSLIQSGQEKYVGLSIIPQVKVKITSGIATVKGLISISHPILGVNSARIDYAIANDPKVDGYVKAAKLETSIDMSFRAGILANANGVDPQKILQDNLQNPQAALSNLFRHKLPQYGLELKGLGIRISKNTDDTINLVLITDPKQS